MAAPKIHEYPDREALAEGLATGVAGVLAGGIATRGRATLAVSGGSTPKLFFDRLSAIDIDWPLVTIVLVDERMVPPGHERSNATLVANHLLKNHAARANFVPYLTDAGSPDECAAANNALIENIDDEMDAVILGMGTDGHTASFFPGGDNLATALNVDARPRVMSMRAKGAGEPRLTLTLPALLEARLLALHIEGDDKRAVLEEAFAGTDVEAMPVRTVLGQSAVPLQIFWAP